MLCLSLPVVSTTRCILAMSIGLPREYQDAALDLKVTPGGQDTRLAARQGQYYNFGELADADEDV